MDENTLHVCCDGGLVTTPDLGGAWQSGANRQLPDLEFFRVAPSPRDSGLVAGSLQDNGNVYAPQYINLDPWKVLEEGDGVITQFATTGDLLHTTNGVKTKDSSGADLIFGSEVRAASWDNGAQVQRPFGVFHVSPFVGCNSGGRGEWGIADPGRQGCERTGERVRADGTGEHAHAEERRGELMVAVGVRGIDVFGLFAKADGNSHWTRIGTVDNLPDKDPMGNPKPYFITAVTSPDGTFVFAGTNNGKTFRLDAPLAGATFPFTNVEPGDGRGGRDHTNRGIRARLAYLIAGTRVFRVWIPPGGAIWTPLTGMVLPSGVSATLPVDQTFTCLAAHLMTPVPALYVGTFFGIWVSEDNGESWLPFTKGLPHVPLCQELRWVQEASGVNFLYVATQGWSVFRRALNGQEGSFSTLVVDGHMDLTDRVLLDDFTGDDYSLVVFGDTRVLGPFHPIDQMKFHGDEVMGGEISADLTLDVLWKIDFSVEVKASASMSADDDELSDGGTVTPGLGETLWMNISMKTGSWSRTGRKISFTATNV